LALILNSFILKIENFDIMRLRRFGKRWLFKNNETGYKGNILKNARKENV